MAYFGDPTSPYMKHFGINPNGDDFEPQGPDTRTEEEKRDDAVLDSLASIGKERTDPFGDYLRAKIREQGFARKIMPPMYISNDELDRSVDTAMPIKIVDKEI